MNKSLSRSDFEDELRTALGNLYDPAVLRDSPLVSSFGLAARAEASNALRHILVEAIASLRPSEDAPPQSTAWRYYHILYGRYTEQLTQLDIGNDLGLSVRQLRRLEKRALQVLADRLWTQYSLGGKEADTAPAPPTPGREEELAWSEAAFPSESVSVDALVHSALETAEPMIRSAQLQVDYEANDGMPRLAVQLVPVRQALLNMLTTTLDWMPEGRLAIRAEHQPGERHVLVTIAGYASRSSPPPDTETERLRVARELVEFSEGQLEIILDLGADRAFSLRLKLPTANQISVLAIDDNPDTLQLLQRYTAGTRYRLAGESDPARCLAMAEKTLPDIILLDVMLQELDGWELLGRFQAHPQLGDRPVIVCTILPQEELALSLGAAAFLSKPLSQRQLLSALDAQVDRLNG